jgi:hypothetical protein
LPRVSLHDASLSLTGPTDPSALRSSRAQQLASQIDNLQVERSQKDEELKKMTKAASESMLLERTAKKRAEASKELIEQHKKRAAKLDREIAALDSSENEGNRLMNQALGGGSVAPAESSRSRPIVSASGAASNSRSARTGIEDLEYDNQDGGLDEEAFFYPDEMNWSPQQVADLQREIIRELLIETEGSAKKAFKKINLNGSGRISCNDFANGVDRLGVPWQDLTGLKRNEQLFRLFDQDKDGVITWPELFPVQASNAADSLRRPTTPVFLDMWFRKNKKEDFPGDRDPPRSSKWSPATPGEELKVLFDCQARHTEAAGKRKWISAAFRRYKAKGKTDARARENIAVHLPRGTGPRDRDGVGTFSEGEVRSCKKSYQDSLIEPVKNVQKEMYAMKEQRRTLQNFCQNFAKVAKDHEKKQIKETTQKEAVGALFPGLGMGMRQQNAHADGDEDD